ncbi:hypothetical protein Hanom_Chr17g01567631 [Helianthus anomalus]
MTPEVIMTTFFACRLQIHHVHVFMHEMKEMFKKPNIYWQKKEDNLCTELV